LNESAKLIGNADALTDVTGIFCTRGNERKSGTKELEHREEEAQFRPDRRNPAAGRDRGGQLF
jgi:hypothetical protein